MSIPTPTPGRRTTPYLLDVDNEFIAGIDTWVAAVPLRGAALFKFRRRDLHPEFNVGGAAMVMEMPTRASIPARELGMPVGSLRSQGTEIAGAFISLFGAY